MSNRLILSGVMTLCVMTSSYAQSSSFEEFRSGLYNDFDSFKSRILEHYSDFLAGEWHEYESLEAMKKYTEPKPETMPVFTAEGAETQGKESMAVSGLIGGKSVYGERNMNEPALMSVLRSGTALYSMPRIGGVSVNDVTSVAEETETVEETSEPALPARSGSIMTAEGLTDSYDGDVFSFYGMQFGIPALEVSAADKVVSTTDFARQWDRLAAGNLANSVNPHLLALQKATGLSDYLLFELTMAYLDHKLPSANDASKMSVAHYLLANMGFGVRLAMDLENVPYMLIPFTEKVFGRARLSLDKDYYVFSTPGKEMSRRLSLITPRLPDNSSTGKSMNLRMNDVTLPEKTYHYDIAYNGIRLEGDMNENIIPMIYRYPQMETGGFAASVISPKVREHVVRQVKEQFADADKLKSADKLLNMIQFGFPYATDDNFHGFEKPYFFEEMLYYPKSDCEDRSIFFSYLLWNALGLENDLITYPGHEATAIRAEKVAGGFDGYNRDGRKFFISDPTYQGAPTGQCMPRYTGMQPGIDLSYE